MFLFAGVRILDAQVLGVLGGIRYLGEARVEERGFMLKRFFWLWVFFVDFRSGFVDVKGLFSGWKFLGDHAESASSLSLKCDFGTNISLRLLLCFMRKVIINKNLSTTF